MKANGISQLPVCKNTPPFANAEVSRRGRRARPDGGDLLDPEVLDMPVETVMGPKLPTIGVGQTIERAVKMLDATPALLVLSGGRPLWCSPAPTSCRTSRRGPTPRLGIGHERSWVTSTSRTRLGFETRAIHAGQEPDPTTGAVVTPISLSTTFAQSAVGVHQGYEYSRPGNPTRTALEACIASLEQADHGLAFASGLAAEDTVVGIARADGAPGGRICSATTPMAAPSA